MYSSSLVATCVVVLFAGGLLFAVSRSSSLSASNRVGWVTLIALSAMGSVMFISAVGHTEPVSLVDRLVAAQRPLASRKEEAVDPLELATAIAAVPKVTREWAALILTVAAHESALSARIAANDCAKHECDGGRAFGLYQAHKNTHNADVWGSSDIRVQTLEAARGLRSGFYVCNGRRKLPVDWVARTINGYAGKRCDAQWPGLDQRLATFNRTVRKL